MKPETEDPETEAKESSFATALRDVEQQASEDLSNSFSKICFCNHDGGFVSFEHAFTFQNNPVRREVLYRCVKCEGVFNEKVLERYGALK